MAARHSSLKFNPTTGQIILKQDGPRSRKPGELSARLLDRTVELVLSAFDQQILLAINGRTELIFRYQRWLGPPHPISRPFAIGATALKITIQRLQVFRDVYYTPPIHPVESLARQLGPDEYFILGDNSPISVDSRSWMGGDIVSGNLFVGRELA